MNAIPFDQASFGDLAANTTGSLLAISQALIWNEQVIDVAFPAMMDLEVIECPPNFKGNTAQGAMKPATLEGGAVVQVPMFIETGERIRIDTKEMKYVSRSEKQ